MAYQMAATAVTLNDLEGHSKVACFFKCNLSNICEPFYTISTDSVLARFLCISRGSFCISRSTTLPNFIALRQPTPEISLTKYLAHKQTVFACIPNDHAK